MVEIISLVPDAQVFISGLGTLSILIIAYCVAKVIYNLYLHPLRKFPGPMLWASSALPAALNNVSGKPHIKLLDLHRQYGEVVRIGPNELAFAHADAWKEICGHLKHGQHEHGKDPKYADESLDKSLISTSRERHGPMRRTLAHAFSARAMADQQPLINRYINLFLQKISERCNNGTVALDMTDWYEFMTFDMIGDLAFGESFGCLEKEKAHPWVNILFDSLKFLPWLQAINDFPFFSILKPSYFVLLMPRDILRKRQDSIEFSKASLGKRLSSPITRPDFVDAMLAAKGGYSMSELEMVDNSVLLTTAGSETTATTLTATTYFLGTHPEVLAKLSTEIRSSFKNEEEININSVQNLPYMLAVLKEVMRVYPPVPIALVRRAAPGGAEIAGRYIPEGTTLGIWQYALYHLSSNFLCPDEFIPDRWLDDQRFANDCKDAHQPFSYGPRNCIGMK
ncbi:hypothetical protein PFICI_05838 [Pestalotiopsis fici W106-1]|uniref:Isotrichodermin C-15 hydroxylase n=1 Tax=Pestalotiopsis fici (strain W106-1 / CGMCC3.15140) TaxID=1229662 RepID=W3XEW6_PESFW|nr:uncharacterized protein PFICI_05838 [Pestalotiopsis fici W106-1]ETS83962.1 hypothetical protein PFICI_05838 [Pestalotiopsis fici W106-1]